MGTGTTLRQIINMTTDSQIIDYPKRWKYMKIAVVDVHGGRTNGPAIPFHSSFSFFLTFKRKKKNLSAFDYLTAFLILHFTGVLQISHQFTIVTSPHCSGCLKISIIWAIKSRPEVITPKRRTQCFQEWGDWVGVRWELGGLTPPPPAFRATNGINTKPNRKLLGIPQIDSVITPWSTHRHRDHATSKGIPIGHALNARVPVISTA